jgi:hypothetical protein
LQREELEMQRKELEKFIEFKIDNRTERMGVIHDNGVTNVNRKTSTGETGARERDFTAIVFRR